MQVRLALRPTVSAEARSTPTERLTRRGSALTANETDCGASFCRPRCSSAGGWFLGTAARWGDDVRQGSEGARSFGADGWHRGAFPEAHAHRRTALVALRGELDLVTVSKVAEVIDDLDPQAVGVRHIVLDLRCLTFVDVIGLHELINQDDDLVPPPLPQ